jgi:chromosome segregation ATPase
LSAETLLETNCQMLLSIQLSWIEIGILFFASTIFGLAVHFFVTTRKSLRQYIQPDKIKASKKDKKELTSLQDKESQIQQLHERLQQAKPKLAFEEEIVVEDKNDGSKDQLIHCLKQTVSQQQKLLNGFLRKVEEMEDNGKEELKLENEDLKAEIKRLEELVDTKGAEIESLQQQVTTAQSMVARIDEIYGEFEALQQRMRETEEKARLVNALEIELEEARESYELARRDMLRKQEKLEQVLNENTELKNQLHDIEDKLTEANRQRQQLQKKVQFLQDLNDDMHNMTEANKKLQTELRRIGELESMLNMIAEERDQLLKKQYK